MFTPSTAAGRWVGLTLIGPLLAIALADCVYSQPGPKPTFEEILPLLDSDDSNLRRKAFETAIGRPEWIKKSAGLLESWLSDPAAIERKEREIAGILQTYGDHPRISRLIVAVLERPMKTPVVRRLMLQIMGRLQMASLPDPWIKSLGALLSGSDRLVQHDAIAVIKMQNLRRFDGRLQAMSRKDGLPLTIRVAALDCIAPRQKGWSPAEFRLLTGQLRNGKQPWLAVVAARALHASRYQVKQQLKLAQLIAKLPPTQGLLLLPVFHRCRDSDVGMALAGALRASPTGNVITKGELDRLLEYYPNDVFGAFKPLRSRIARRAAMPMQHVALVAADLPAGDSGRGRHVFFSDKAKCSTCHRAAGKGGGTGPNLSRIAVIRSHRQLLESIVWPSRDIAPEFRGFVVATRAGQVHRGLVVQETADALFLRTAGTNRLRIALAEVEEVVLSMTSLMPEGFDKALSRQELSDLVEFLASRR